MKAILLITPVYYAGLGVCEPFSLIHTPLLLLLAIDDINNKRKTYENYR